MRSISDRNNKIYWITQFFSAMVFTMPIIIVFLQQRISIFEVSFLMGLRYLVQLIFELPTGALSDLLGKKLTIIIGFIICSINYSLIPFGQSFGQFVLFYTFMGISNAFLSGSVDALVYDSLKQDHKEGTYLAVLSKQQFLYQIGLVIGSLAGGFLYVYNNGLPFYMVTFVSVIATVFSFFFIEPLVDSEKFTIKNYLKQMKQGIKEIFKTTYLRRLSLLYISVGGITWSCAIYFNSFMLVELGFSDQTRGLLDGGLRLLNITILTWFLKQQRIFTRTVSILFFPAMMIFAFLPGRWLFGYYALPFVAASMVSATARWIILGKLTNQEFTSKYRATAISALSFFVGIVYVIITIVSGPIIQNFGGVRMMYTLLGVLTIITVLPLAISVLKRQTYEYNIESGGEVASAKS